MLPKLLPRERVLIKVVNLVLVQRPIFIVVFMMAVLALEPHHLTFFTNVFLEVLEREPFQLAAEAFEVVTWALS